MSSVERGLHGLSHLARLASSSPIPAWSAAPSLCSRIMSSYVFGRTSSAMRLPTKSELPDLFTQKLMERAVLSAAHVAWPTHQTHTHTHTHMAVGQNQWYHFGVGAPPILVYFNGDWDVHYGSLTHGHIHSLAPCVFPWPRKGCMASAP